MSELSLNLSGHDRYQAMLPLAKGGMGSVYLVFDTRREKKVALKILKDQASGSIYRFKREFRATADLIHPNLIRLYDLGVLPSGQLFYTMEFIEGITLSDFISRQAELSPLVRFSLAGVLDGLAHLHVHQKVHRDLKPQNIMISPDTGHATILDFGILREIDNLDGVTKHYTPIGTPNYMSPEQVSGDPVTPAADMYAFGCLLYEILSGRIVFPAENTKEILHQHLVATPTPPSAIRPCDTSLEGLCLRLLSKNPKDRPSAIEALDELSSSLKYVRARSAASPNASKVLGLIGRQEELRALEEEMHASKEGPRLVLLGAESGLGKSALLAEFALLSQEKKINVWQGRCYEREDIPYKAFDAIVDSLTAALARRQSEELPPGLNSLTKIFPVLKEAFALQTESPSDASLHDPWSERRRAWSSLFLLIKRLSGKTQPVLLLEDLQWADEESFRLLRWFCRSDVSCLIIASYQSEPGKEPPPSIASLSGENVKMIALRPLDDAAIGVLLDLYAPSLNAEERRTLLRESKGNPLLAQEMARALQEGRGGSLGLRALVESRISRLSDKMRTVLEIAAVLGGKLSFSLLREVSGFSSAQLTESIDELLQVGFLQETGDELYDIVHEPLRSAAYQQSPMERRLQYHRAFGRIFDERGNPAKAAEHWEKAGDTERAREAALLAAKKAEEKLAFNQAAELYVLAGGEHPSWEIEMARGKALRKAGIHRAAAQAFESASRLAPQEDSLEAKLSCIGSRLTGGEVSEGVLALKTLLKEIGVRLPRFVIVYLLSVIFGMLWLHIRFYFNDLPGLFQKAKRRKAPSRQDQLRLRVYESMQYHLLSLDPLLATYLGVRHGILAMKLGDASHIGRAMIAHALRRTALFGNWRMESVFLHIYIGESLCLSVGDNRGVLDGQYSRGLMYLMDANWEGVRRSVATGEEIARREGLFGEPVLLELRNFYVGGYYLSGDHPWVIQNAKSYLAEIKDRGNVMDRADSMALLGLSHLSRGEAIGCKLIQEALALLPEEPLTLVRFRVEVISAEVDMYNSEPEKGLAKLAALRERWINGSFFATTFEYSLFGWQRARLELLWMALNQNKRCPHRVGLPFYLSTRATVPSFQDEEFRLKGALKAREGDLSGALSLVHKALGGAERHGNQYGIAVALSAKATLCRRLGIPGAEYDRARAAEIFKSLGISDCYVLSFEGWDDPTVLAK